MPSFMTTVALAALSIVPSVYGHGHVFEVRAGGKTWKAAPPHEADYSDSVGWPAANQDNGFVGPDSFGSADMICHKGAKPGGAVMEVEAGTEIELAWDTWPESHHGPVLNYLARCHGDCTKITEEKKEKLTFFAIQAEGLKDPSDPNGWASDEIIANGFVAKVKIPDNIRGNFVLRHEILALHSAASGEPQSYPQCISLKVTGSGKSHPCNEGADCRKGTDLYTSNDPGATFNLYEGNTDYPIPGPTVFAGLKKRFAQVFRA